MTQKTEIEKLFMNSWKEFLSNAIYEGITEEEVQEIKRISEKTAAFRSAFYDYFKEIENHKKNEFK